MASQSAWPVVPVRATDGEEPLFFTPEEWDTVEAITARIIPTDYDPGAREAKVVRFLDRFLSGTQFVYASADGSGFLQMSGIDADAWEKRIDQRQQTYREGLGALSELSRTRHGKEFVDLTDQEQDGVLEELSGKPKPARVSLVSHGENAGEGGPPPTNQPVSDEGLGFFDSIVLHTRQGFYADPAYGGNDNFTGWNVIGYPGPRSLKDTMDGTFTTTDYMLMDATWPYANHPSVQRYRLHRPKS
jgi:gluconate 2-dehydrogenase gamma chain